MFRFLQTILWFLFKPKYTFRCHLFNRDEAKFVFQREIQISKLTDHQYALSTQINNTGSFPDQINDQVEYFPLSCSFRFSLLLDLKIIYAEKSPKRSTNVQTSLQVLQWEQPN